VTRPDTFRSHELSLATFAPVLPPNCSAFRIHTSSLSVADETLPRIDVMFRSRMISAFSEKFYRPAAVPLKSTMPAVIAFRR
jgi:hypothetical protein